jgi:hypothetical protein
VLARLTLSKLPTAIEIKRLDADSVRVLISTIG